MKLPSQILVLPLVGAFVGLVSRMIKKPEVAHVPRPFR